jgi:LDH2 family malate/lactate/ureidoglycolate dehydrogenase
MAHEVDPTYFDPLAVSAMRLLAAAERGEAVPESVGLDRNGHPTTDPGSILDGGAQLPFGGHKGSVALMVEIMAAALTGGRFGFEDESARHPGARTSNAGLAMIVITRPPYRRRLPNGWARRDGLH